MGIIDFFRRGGGPSGDDVRARRAAVYQKVFGSPTSVIADVSASSPRVDVHVYPAGLAGREYLTLVTSGVSDLRMNVPAADQGPLRCELVLYCMAPSADIIQYLRAVAMFPTRSGHWLAHGFTIRDEHDAPAFSKSALVATVVVDALFDEEMTVPSRLVIDGDPVHLLFPIPLTAKEHDFVVEHGVQKFFDGPLARSEYDLMCNPQRRSTL